MPNLPLSTIKYSKSLIFSQILRVTRGSQTITYDGTISLVICDSGRKERGKQELPMDGIGWGWGGWRRAGESI